jgi:hypothetical protein
VKSSDCVFTVLIKIDEREPTWRWCTLSLKINSFERSIIGVYHFYTIIIPLDFCLLDHSTCQIILILKLIVNKCLIKKRISIFFYLSDYNCWKKVTLNLIIYLALLTLRSDIGNWHFHQINSSYIYFLSSVNFTNHTNYLILIAYKLETINSICSTFFNIYKLLDREFLWLQVIYIYYLESLLYCLDNKVVGSK